MILCVVHCKIHLVACGLGQLLMLYVLSYCLPGFFLEFKSDSKENYFLSKNIFLKIKKKKRQKEKKSKWPFKHWNLHQRYYICYSGVFLVKYNTFPNQLALSLAHVFHCSSIVTDFYFLIFTIDLYPYITLILVCF